MCVSTSVCALPSEQQNSQRGVDAPTGTATPPSTLHLRTSEGGGTGLFRGYRRRYTSVGAETACACLRVCAPSPHHSRPASGALTRPPARPHHPPRSISGPQKGGGGACFGCTSAAMASLELKLRLRRYEGVRRPRITAPELRWPSRGIARPTTLPRTSKDTPRPLHNGRTEGQHCAPYNVPLPKATRGNLRIDASAPTQSPRERR